MAKSSLQVTYYALLRQESGLSTESVQTDASTIEELFLELKEKHSFSLLPKQVRAALNGKVQPFKSSISDGDIVHFIPPVAGG